MQAQLYPFIDLAVHAAVRERFAKGDAVAILSPDLDAMVWANGAAASLFGFDNIYDALDEGFSGQAATRRQIESALSGLRRTGRPQAFMMRLSSGFSRTMTQASLEDITLPDGAPALMLVSSQAGQILAPGARARRIISGFEGTGTHVAVLDRDGKVLAASSTFGEIGLAASDIDRLIADVAGQNDRLVKRMTHARGGAMPTAIGRLADDPAMHLLFAVEPSVQDDADADGDAILESGDAAIIAPVSVDLGSEGSMSDENLDMDRSADGDAGDAAAATLTSDDSDAETLSSDVDHSSSADTGSADETGHDAADEAWQPEVSDHQENAETPDEGEQVRDETETPQAPAEVQNEGERASEAHTWRPGSFDTSRIREELNARLEKARAEQAAREAEEVPQPFADARNLVSGYTGDDDHQDEGDSNFDADAGSTLEADSDTASDADHDVNLDADLESGPVIDPETGEETDEPDMAAVDQAQVDAPDALSADETQSDEPEPAEEPDHLAETAESDHVADAGEPGLEAAGSEPDEQGSQFRFNPDAKPARFVWKIGRDGRFSEVSPEFAAAVGPNSADIVGRSFPDLARVFNLDPDHVISDLLNRRDTWSGKTVYWPIQGTALSTPVDLAALPTYTRDRQFDGFRGFGIVRIGETRQDPEALGLALVPGARPNPEELRQSLEELEGDAGGDAAEQHGADDYSASEAQEAEDEADLEIRNLEQDIEDLARLDGADQDAEDNYGATDGSDDDGSHDSNASDSIETTDEDPFRGERPAIRLVETPMRRDSDKIIDLEARRGRPREGLSPGEQAAFREIGARLTETASHDMETDDGDSQSATPDEQTERPAFGRRQSSADDVGSGSGDIEISFDGEQSEPADTDQADQPGIEASEFETGIDEAGFDGTDDDAAAAAGAADQPDFAEDGADEDSAEAVTSEAGDDNATVTPEAEWIEPPVVEPMPSAFALPARQGMHAGIDAGLIDAIPAALLVHSGDDLIHANAEFLALTGYASLDELAARGGLDHLLDRTDEDGGAGDGGGMLVRRGDGGACRVTARLRSINWGDGQALLLALAPIEAQAPLMDAPVITPVEAEALAQTGDPMTVPTEVGAADTADHDEKAALKIEAQELRSILETATDGVVILDNDGSIRSMNGSACALFNYDEGETQGQPFAMLFAHESQRAVMDYVAGLSDHGVSSVLNDGREVIGREASGGFLPLFMTIGRLSGSNGFCAVLRDITQWKRTEEELRNAKRAAETANSHKSDFLARVSHEIRTPLNAIIGFSEMMVEERFGPIGSPRYLEYAHDIGNSGKHVLDIVNDLLDISKIEAGQEQLEFVAVSLNDHLAESVSLLQPMANSQRVIIRTSLSASVPEVVADRRSIKQIALNLLSNAIRFTPSGGQIVVSTSYEPTGNVVIRIRDTGIGMSRKELEQAMKPFGQVGPGPRQRGEGTGLGLPLTKAMVEANRAQFDIVSTPSEGTLVSISFPPQRVLAD